MDKGQIRMTETIAVLFIFFVLILFGIIFYYQYQKVAIGEKQEELLGARAMDTTLKVLHLPELICSKGEAEPERNCFDLMKMRSLGEAMEDEYYFDLFSYATITVQEIFPGEEEWVLYDQPKPDFERKEPTYFVVSLRDDTQEEHRFGYVKVEVYS